MKQLQHLIKRFLSSLTARRANESEITWLKNYLSERELSLWLRFARADQRHSLVVTRRFEQFKPNATIEETAAALLHDIGKIQSELGVFGRVVATMIGPRTPKFTNYLEHESLGVLLLEGIGTDGKTIELLRGDGDPDVIRLLRRADEI